MKLFSYKDKTFYLSKRIIVTAAITSAIVSWLAEEILNSGALLAGDVFAITAAIVITIPCYIYAKFDWKIIKVKRKGWGNIRNVPVEVKIRNNQMEILKMIKKDDDPEFIYKAIKYKMAKEFV